MFNLYHVCWKWSRQSLCFMLLFGWSLWTCLENISHCSVYRTVLYYCTNLNTHIKTFATTVTDFSCTDLTRLIVHQHYLSILTALPFQCVIFLAGHSCGMFRRRGKHPAAIRGQENEAEQRLSAIVWKETAARRIEKNGSIWQCSGYEKKQCRGGERCDSC